MPTVSTAHFDVPPGTRDCRDCAWFGGLERPTWDIARCSNPKGSPIVATASQGCVMWVKRVERPKRRQVQQEPGDPRPEPPPNW